MIFISFPRKRKPRPPRKERRLLYSLKGEFPPEITRRIAGVRMAQFRRLTGEFDKTPKGAKLKADMERGIKAAEAISGKIAAENLAPEQFDAETKRIFLEEWKTEAGYGEAMIAFMEKEGVFPGVIEPGKRRLRQLKEKIANPPWKKKK